VRTAAAVTAVLVLLLGVQLAGARLGTSWQVTVYNAVTALGVVVAARAAGMSWTDLGLGAGALRRGAGYAVAGVLALLVGYVVLLAVPWSRALLLDERHQQTIPAALLVALVVVPLRTVLLEEIAFRGALWGLLRRSYGESWATAASSVLFGVWHLPAAVSFGESSPVVDDTGVALAWVAVATAALMALVGALLCELRRRTGSLVPAVAWHWAANGFGVVAVAVAWATAGSTAAS
ncbi:MAG: lysostaphin resistance A-like protein, partial [Nocardioidaceae bacterium]